MDNVVSLGLTYRHLAGALLQSLAVAVISHGDVNTSYTTRAVGSLMVALLFTLGTIICAAAPFRLFALLVPLVRADLVFLLLTRLIRSFIWAGRLSPRSILYISEVFPLQAAAMIWNDCRPITPHNAVEDERSVFVDWLFVQRDIWRPTQFDGVTSRSVKLPVFVVLQALSLTISGIEVAIFRVWKALFNRGASNRVPVEIQGSYPEVLGHSMLISDKRLTWVQRFTMQWNDIDESREARRVAFRALHSASLLTHGGHARLHEAGPSGYAMSEYYAAVVGNDAVKVLLSRYDQLEVLPKLPNGNKTTRGQPIPRQVVWARLVAGSFIGLRGEGRWRGPVAISLFQVAQENVERFGAGMSRTAIQRHVYTVMRRWLVNWMTYIWWEIDMPADIVNDPDEFFSRLDNLLTNSLVHNTTSLPHAVGELAVSIQRQNDVNAMLAMVLGEDWELWMQQSVVESGETLLNAMTEAGEWKCMGQALEVGVSVDSRLYGQMPLGDAMVASAEDSLARQARAKLASRVIATLSNRLRNAWQQQPNRLLDNPNVQANEE